jgi:hypothetical protein
VLTALIEEYADARALQARYEDEAVLVETARSNLRDTRGDRRRAVAYAVKHLAHMDRVKELQRR